MSLYDPHYSQFPPEIKALDSAEWKELGLLLDDLEADMKDAIHAMNDFWDIEKIPLFMLPLIAHTFAADIFYDDSEILKRRKVRDSIANWHAKGLRTPIVKAIYDVTGVVPVLSEAALSIHMIWESVGDQIPSPVDFMKWASAEDPGATDGMIWRSNNDTSSAGALGSEKGVITIDLRRDDLTVLELEKLQHIIEIFGAAYFTYVLGAQTLDGWLFYRQINTPSR